MKLAALSIDGKETIALTHDNRFVSIETINEMEGTCFEEDFVFLLREGQFSELCTWYKTEGKQKLSAFPSIKEEAIEIALCKNPSTVLGVGMNYVEKAIELSGNLPEEEPVMFTKPSSTLVGPNQSILLPVQSKEVTAEGELAIVIGKQCKNVKQEDAKEFIAGFTTALDVTAKDIHGKNPRYLQRSKSFDTFCSIGNSLVTLDEFSSLREIKVETVLNGEVRYSNTVSNMMYEPLWLLEFFSSIVTLNPGDIILTGTPGSVLINEKDVVECRVTELAPLKNDVRAGLLLAK
jgi:2-keto-4-pentenoate hydratase/2-oxohepta-3-ene-1,7-dioic acid hydratase in catechol pathway